MLYGAENWWQGGFTDSFDTQREGWFGKETEFGGVDKLGHAYSNYVGVRLLTPVFEAMGNTRRTSVSLATWSTLAIFTGVEVLDGFSQRYYFSIEDTIANIAGQIGHPRIGTLPDFGNFYEYDRYQGVAEMMP